MVGAKGMRTKTVTIIRRQILFGYLIGFILDFDSTPYGGRVIFNWTCGKVDPGSTTWQLYRH